MSNRGGWEQSFPGPPAGACVLQVRPSSTARTQAQGVAVGRCLVCPDCFGPSGAGRCRARYWCVVDKRHSSYSTEGFCLTVKGTVFIF